MHSKRILIVGPSWVGDMVMAQSLFKLLKQQDERVLLDVLAPAWTFSLLSRMPEVDQAIVMPIEHGELRLRERYKLATTLQKNNYAQAIVLPNSFKAALIPWFARIDKRTGWLGECRYGVLNDYRRLDKTRYPLMIEQFMALALPPNEALPTHYPYPAFDVSHAAKAAVLAKYRPTFRGAPVLALCPGAEFGPAKRWPAAYFAAVANKKMAEGWDVWLLGSLKDRPITEHIMAATNERCAHLAGQLALAETIDLLALATGVLTNDSGLMHIASALKKPLIALYGSTSPAFTPPFSKQAQILKLQLDCQPCFKRQCPFGHYRCLHELTPDRILTAMRKWGS